MDAPDVTTQKPFFGKGVPGPKKVLVTGATGFIGSYVIAELLKTGCRIIATSSNVLKAKSKSWFDKVQYIPFNFGDFEDGINYQDYFNAPDAVIHLAWEGLPNYKAAFHLEKNLPVHFAFLKNLVEHGQTDLTVTGTCFEYGMQEGCLTEEMETFPQNAYAIAKDHLRRQLQQLQQEHSFGLKWVRLFYMYGKGQNANSLLSQLEKALENDEPVFNMSGGEQVRDYLKVEKVAEYIVSIALQNKITGIVNCCRGSGVSVKELVQNYLEEKNKTISLNLGYYPYTDYEPMRFWGDDKKLKMILHYNDHQQD
jgi:dTDP-6-deoxy-L-talose 4-dehydrogenase (NAD+)